MRKLVYLLLLPIAYLVSCQKDKTGPTGMVSYSGRIYTIAGNGYNQGLGGYSGDGGQATVAELGGPWGVAVDNVGNLYIADGTNHRVRKINDKGIISTVAGNGINGYSGDGGTATDAEISPVGVTVDVNGNIYIADAGNNVIRKVTSSGIISTFAGNGYDAGGFGGYSGDNGPATLAELGLPYGVAVDASDNLYIADYANAAIRKVNASGTITTVAGGVQGSYSGDGGPATAAGMNPYGVAVDTKGNIYIADYVNNRVRMVNTSGIITTIAGNGYNAPLDGGYSGDGGPATSAEIYYPTDVKVDGSGNVCINDAYNGRIRVVNTIGIITTVAGIGSYGSYAFSGDGGLATNAEIGYSQGIAVDGSGNIYISDLYMERIRKVFK